MFEQLLHQHAVALVAAACFAVLLWALSSVCQAIQEDYRDHRGKPWLYWKHHQHQAGFVGWLSRWMLRRTEERPYDRKRRPLTGRGIVAFLAECVNRFRIGWLDMWWDGWHGVKTLQRLLTVYGTAVTPCALVLGWWGFLAAPGFVLMFAVPALVAFELTYRGPLRRYAGTYARE